MSDYLKNVPFKSFAAVSAVGLLVYKLVTGENASANNRRCILIENVDEWDRHESEICNIFNTSCVLGLDCEWVTVAAQRNRISLLQLADDSGFCVLVRLSCLPSCQIPPPLVGILQNEDILKVGVGIAEDVDKLFNDYAVEVNGFIDLRFLVQDCEELRDKGLSLKTLGLELLDINLNKDEKLRRSNWEDETLSEAQMNYAADDAIVAAQLFSEIRKRKYHWFWDYKNFSREVRSLINIPFKQNGVLNKMVFSKSKKKCDPHPCETPQNIRYSKPRQRPMYDNCLLVAPDGELLCSCDKGKAEWYISKGLGEKVNDDPFTVGLNFEPSGRPRLDNIFYTKEKANQCVVCGNTENFHRKLVVPSEYRKYFPDIMKKNLSHDVLLLCAACHKKSNMIDQEMRLRLAEKCDAPLGCKKNVKYKFNPELARVKSAATALISNGDKIPVTRQNELQKLIANYYDVEHVSEVILKHAHHLDASVLNKGFVPHGLKVYKYFCKNGGLVQFERMWRQHFLDTMQPKYLPTMWSVEHNHQRLAIQVRESIKDIEFDVSILGLGDNIMENLEGCQSEE